MSNKSYTKLEVVQASTSSEFQQLFNSKMDELKDFDPAFEFVHNQGFCAYITYKYSEEIIGIVGDRLPNTCGSCAHGCTPRSSNVKWIRCSKLGAAVNKKTSACEEYLQGVCYGN